jgi:hypothetical protein
MQRWRAGIALGGSFFVGAALAIACGGDNGTPGAIHAGGDDASIDHRGTGKPGDPTTSDDDDDAIDAGADAGADAAKGGSERDANGPGGDGATCSFNWDCQLALRCECDGDCACKTGKRGTGKPGSVCTDFNDCVSAVCLEGPNADELLCSDECKVATDCPTNLPRCEDIAFVGRICVREPPP